MRPQADVEVPDRSEPITAGSVIGIERWASLSGKEVTVPNEAGLTHIQFRRFAGCPVCNLHLRSFITRRGDLVRAGVHEVIVFHSSADELRVHESELPFDVIPDPTKRLYRRFGVESSRRALLHPRAWWPIARAVLRSSIRLLLRQRHLPPVNPSGGRFGLPGDFLVAADGSVLGVHYGAHAYDQWTVDEVLELASGRLKEGDGN